MKRFSKQVENRRTHYSSKHLKSATNQEERPHRAFLMTNPATDRQLADEFRSHMKQTECHLARIEGLLRRIA